MKYIIKNCPAQDVLGEECCYWNVYKKCADCDCVLKQIVEKCRGVQEKFYDAVHSRYLSPSKAKFAREILNMLEIEEKIE